MYLRKIIDLWNNPNNSYDKIDGYFFSTIKDCLEKKKKANDINDKAIIKKLELYLSSLDNYQYERSLREQI